MANEVTYLMAGLVLGLLLGGFGIAILNKGDFDYIVNYEGTGADTGTLDPAGGDIDTVAERTLGYLSANFLERQGLTGTVVNAVSYGPNLVRVDMAINQGGRLLDSTSVFVTVDGETILFLSQPPLNTSESLDQGSDEPSQPEKLDISIEGDPFRGDPDAPVTIIEFSEYQCPYCGAAAGTNQDLIAMFKSQDPSWEPAIPNIVENYVNTGKVKMVFKDYPLPFHEYATKAAEASMCAYEQDRFWAYHDILFENQAALDIDSLKAYAGDLGLNTDDFNECLDSLRYAGEVERDMAQGQSAGVSGTPAFFVNGQLVSGAQPYSTFVAIIEAELAE